MECIWRKKCSVKCERTSNHQEQRLFVKKFYSLSQICANAQTLQVMEGCECCKWKIPIVLRIKIVNISRHKGTLQISTACSATAPCTAWSTAPGNPRYFEKNGRRIQGLLRAAPSPMIRSIMIRSCKILQGATTHFLKTQSR